MIRSTRVALNPAFALDQSSPEDQTRGLLAALRAHSPALLAFGSDRLVELQSASVVLLQFLPSCCVSERRATRAGAILLFALAGILGLIAGLSFAGRAVPETTRLGVGLTIIAPLIMPALGWLKRRGAKRLNNSALGADAIQSTTCPYLAVVTLIGLALDAAFHVGWSDSAAALVAVPLLLQEGREAWHGRICRC